MNWRCYWESRVPGKSEGEQFKTERVIVVSETTGKSKRGQAEWVALQSIFELESSVRALLSIRIP